MSKHKDEKLLFHLKDLAGDFLSRNSNRTSLITVTNVVMSSDLKRANILLSVLPKEKERVALLFANRLRPEFKEYVKEHSRMRILPQVTFAPDLGEQNRLRIEELASQTHADLTQTAAEKPEAE
ncbi:MAG: ribosome-binding factor A [bacterium]|nr:ribosome-binding factor A [bacterium]